MNTDLWSAWDRRVEAPFVVVLVIWAGVALNESCPRMTVCFLDSYVGEMQQRRRCVSCWRLGLSASSTSISRSTVVWHLGGKHPRGT